MLPSPVENETRYDYIRRVVKQADGSDAVEWIKKASAAWAEVIERERAVDFRATGTFCKSVEHEDYTFVLGPVLVPESIDKQGDIISGDEIEMTAHDYMEDSQRPGLMHQLMLGTRDVQVVESYILRNEIQFDERVVKSGTWMLGMRVYNEKLRKMIREGTLKGYSIGGHGSITEEVAS